MVVETLWPVEYVSHQVSVQTLMQMVFLSVVFLLRAKDWGILVGSIQMVAETLWPVECVSHQVSVQILMQMVFLSVNFLPLLLLLPPLRPLPPALLHYASLKRVGLLERVVDFTLMVAETLWTVDCVLMMIVKSEHFRCSLYHRRLQDPPLVTDREDLVLVDPFHWMVLTDSIPC
jgi:hypothetical protein